MDVKRYCRYTGRICEFATEFGYCKITVCVKGNFRYRRMCCQYNYKSNIRTDCIHYHCEHDMGASIDCCTLKGLGNCPCTKDCPDYVDKAEVYRLGLEVLKQKGKN